MFNFFKSQDPKPEHILIERLTQLTLDGELNWELIRSNAWKTSFNEQEIHFYGTWADFPYILGAGEGLGAQSWKFSRWSRQAKDLIEAIDQMVVIPAKTQVYDAIMAEQTA